MSDLDNTVKPDRVITDNALSMAVMSKLGLAGLTEQRLNQLVEQLGLQEFAVDKLLNMTAEKLLKSVLEQKKAAPSQSEPVGEPQKPEPEKTAVENPSAENAVAEPPVETVEEVVLLEPRRTPEEITAAESERSSNDAKIEVSVDADALCAKITLYAPIEDGKKLTEDDIIETLHKHGVVRGVKMNYIERLAKHPVYKTSFKIAQGEEATIGENGEMICHFDVKNSLVPKVLEDGSTDYKNLGFANEVKEGDLLCELIPATTGKNGFTVLNKELLGKNGKDAVLPMGSNVVLSEDGMRLYAGCDGHVSLKENKIQVRRIMTLPQVDRSTGNILFSGDVCVNGDVRDGFTVRAGGNITVKGVVESATLVAGRDIVISKGIHGKDSLVSAGGDLRTGYIEMSQVRAKGNIFVDMVLNATVISEKKVTLTGKRGCFIGGVCRAAEEIEAKQIGNEANIATEVIVIGLNTISAQKERLAARLAECEAMLSRFSQTIRVLIQSYLPREVEQRAVITLLANKLKVEGEIQVVSQTLSELEFTEGEEKTGHIIAKNCIYPNVTVNIDGMIFKNAHYRPNCMASKGSEKIIFNTRGSTK